MFRELAQLFLGEVCPGCARPALGGAAESRSRWCRACSRAMIPDVQIDSLGDRPVASAFDYAGVPREAVVEWKSHQRADVHSVLVDVLAETVLTLMMTGEGLTRDAPVTLVPIPTSRRSRSERGTALVERLTKDAAQRLTGAGVHVQAHEALRLVRSPRDQVDLTAHERWQNLAGAMMARSRPTGQIVVVDDIVTTGATVAEAISAMSRADQTVAAVASIARARRSRSDLSEVSVAEDPRAGYGQDR